MRTQKLRSSSHLLGLMTLAASFGCAPAIQPKIAVPMPTVSHGTILSMRPVGDHTSAEPFRVALVADATGDRPNDRPLVEFIVRADDGATLSIVQANEAGFRTGDRVVILRDDTARLAPSR
jgi:outer membrane lipoprotein SlyB